jgi:hypothetical protein
VIDGRDPSGSLPIPAKWATTDLADLTSVSEADEALRSGVPQAWLAKNAHKRRSNFAAEFWRRINGPRGHVVLELPLGMSSVAAAVLVSAWMGLRPDQVHGDIGGTVSHVVSGAGHRHDQSWHTDSTPWQEPNRYSALGLLSGVGTDDQSTDLLALNSLQQRLVAVDPAAWMALQTEPIEWRHNFPHLANLQAPVFGPQKPRWVWPVLMEQMDEFSPALRRGVGLVARLVNEVPYDSPVVTMSKLLVFDNGRMLHRGPHLEESSGRELIRVKVAGKATA